MFYGKRVITESALLQKACYYGKYVITEKCVMSIISKKTIFAPITPVAMSAVGVIRISGERTFDILSEIFSKSLKDVKSHTCLLYTSDKKEPCLPVPSSRPSLFLFRFYIFLFSFREKTLSPKKSHVRLSQKRSLYERYSLPF